MNENKIELDGIDSVAANPSTSGRVSEFGSQWGERSAWRAHGDAFGGRP